MNTGWLQSPFTLQTEAFYTGKIFAFLDCENNSFLMGKKQRFRKQQLLQSNPITFTGLSPESYSQPTLIQTFMIVGCKREVILLLHYTAKSFRIGLNSDTTSTQKC